VVRPLARLLNFSSQGSHPEEKGQLEGKNPDKVLGSKVLFLSDIESSRREKFEKLG
jgi:hypothetical protein